MNKLTIIGQSLRLQGHKNTLELADRHNRRLIASEIGCYGNIDGRRSLLNVTLVPLNGKSLEKTVKEIITNKGIDLSHYLLKKKNRGYAVEFVFTVRAGHQCDFNAMYADCLNLLREYYPTCPIAHAVIHHDEDTPHMHVILVPLFNGGLHADEVKGYKGVSQERNKFFFDKLNESYGLTFPIYLKGSMKKKGVELALHAYRKIPDDNLRSILDNGITQAIYARPEPFLHALGITLDHIVMSNKTTPT